MSRDITLWALRDSNPRPLPCKGRLVQRSDQHSRRSSVVPGVTGVPSSTAWFPRLLDQMLTTEGLADMAACGQSRRQFLGRVSEPELPVGLSRRLSTWSVSADQHGESGARGPRSPGAQRSRNHLTASAWRRTDVRTSASPRSARSRTTSPTFTRPRLAANASICPGRRSGQGASRS
jgi:hypothetical protein